MQGAYADRYPPAVSPWPCEFFELGCSLDKDRFGRRESNGKTITADGHTHVDLTRRHWQGALGVDSRRRRRRAMNAGKREDRIHRTSVPSCPLRKAARRNGYERKDMGRVPSGRRLAGWHWQSKARSSARGLPRRSAAS